MHGNVRKCLWEEPFSCFQLSGQPKQFKFFTSHFLCNITKLGCRLLQLPLTSILTFTGVDHQTFPQGRKFFLPFGLPYCPTGLVIPTLRGHLSVFLAFLCNFVCLLGLMSQNKRKILEVVEESTYVRFNGKGVSKTIYCTLNGV